MQRRRRRARWAIAVLLAGGAAWLSLRQIRWEVVGATLARLDVALFALALLSVLATTAVKAVRWQVLLRACGRGIGFGPVLRALLIGQMGNSLLPARLGDAARVVVIGPRVQGGIPAALGTVVAEKVLDGVLGLFILVGLAQRAPLPNWLRHPILGLAGLTAVLLAVILLFGRQEFQRAGLWQAMLRRLPPTWQDQPPRLLAGFALGLGVLRRPQAAGLGLLLSVAVWGLAVMTNLLAAAALGIEAPGWSAWLVLASVYAIGFLPAVPAQVGLFEYACLLALTTAGVVREPALAFGLVLHFLVILPPAVLGPVAMLIEGLKWDRLDGELSQ